MKDGMPFVWIYGMIISFSIPIIVSGLIFEGFAIITLSGVFLWYAELIAAKNHNVGKSIDVQSEEKSGGD